MNEQVLVIDVYRDAFEAWVRKNWERKHHNFSVKDDGKYFYTAMQDAFDVWLGAKGMEYV
jgi:hypothetical protein